MLSELDSIVSRIDRVFDGFSLGVLLCIRIQSCNSKEEDYRNNEHLRVLCMQHVKWEMTSVHCHKVHTGFCRMSDKESIFFVYFSFGIIDPRTSRLSVRGFIINMTLAQNNRKYYSECILLSYCILPV